ncbi:MAG: O-antigen ligase domain-containing protein [Phycisphaera sp.]|nr:O-antigen ligase domain-containing protein [Phycisphaera sp.]
MLDDPNALGEPNVLVYFALWGWVPVVLALFASMRPRRAVIVAFIVAWLFLPMAGFTIKGLPDYTKMSATCAGILMATVIFDANRLLRFRPRWIDLPAAVFCFCPVLSSLKNGLGLYDGVSVALVQTVAWGLPYLIGRLYFTDLSALKELAVGVFIGGLVYVPLCLYEVRMSPQFHHLVYGYHAHDFAQTMRFGGWRPTVFMQHGLMVGMWMCMTALVGMWLWWTGALKKIRGVGVALPVVALLATAVFCKSMGAVVLMVFGIGALACAKWFHLRLAMVALLIAAPLYVGLRSTGRWDGLNLVEMARMVSADRAQSMAYRLHNEELLNGRAQQSALFGWGGWGRNRVYDAKGNDITVIDGQWINVFGIWGYIGLFSMTALLLLPGALLIMKFPVRLWAHPYLAPATVMACVGVLYMIDSVVNAMVNPVFLLMIGATAGTLYFTAVPSRAETNAQTVYNPESLLHGSHPSGQPA